MTHLPRAALLAALLLVTVGCIDRPTQTDVVEGNDAATTPTCDLTATTGPDCLAWSVWPVTPPAGVGPDVVVVRADPDVQAHATASGDELWDATPGASFVPTGIVVTPAGVLVSATPTDGTFAPVTDLLDAGSGSRLWSAVGALADVAADGSVAVLVADGLATGIEVATGDQLWRLPVAGPDAVTVDAEVALVEDDEGVTLVEHEDGDARWTLLGVGRVPTPRPADVVNGEVVLLHDGTDTVLVDRDEGGATGTVAGRSGLVDDVLVAVAGDGVRGLADDGEEAWFVPGRGLLGSDGRVLLLAREGADVLARLDPATGDELWAVPATGGVTDVVAGEVHVFVTRRGSVTVHVAATGAPVLEVRAPDVAVVTADPFTVAWDDHLGVIPLP